MAKTSTDPNAEARAYLAAIVDSSDDAIIAKDLNGIIQSCNATAERLFGYPRHELVGQPVRILIPADRQQEEDTILDRIRRGERIEHFETIRRKKSGELIDLSLTVSPVRDESGQIIGVSKIARDITDRKRSAEAIAAQQEWFRVTLASIGDAVIACDANGGVVFMNPIAERLTGWTAETAAGHPSDEVFHIVHETTGAVMPSPVMRVLTEGTVIGLANHTALVSLDGRRFPIDDSGAPIRSRDGTIIGVVLVFRDVTERRRVEAERHTSAKDRERLLDAERAARAEAERASRVKDEFVAMVSHELRTPLNAILGWTALMMQGRNNPAILDRGLNVVSRNTRVQAQLISDLLDISRIVSGKLTLEFQDVSLATILDDAVETVSTEAQARRVAIVKRVETPGVAVAGDPARLQQVVWNLLSNAVKFTPSGGSVTVSLVASGDMVEIAVTDTGTGMRPEVIPHVFDRFHQADRSITRRFGGLGLGLSIVKHLVELHGGSVHAESPGEGLGSTSASELPITEAGHDAGHEQRAHALEAADPVRLDTLRVLVVEDEPDTLEYVTRLLSGHGATVTGTRSAPEALEAFHRERPDILISDIGLPGTDGYELLAQIRREDAPGREPFPAIALTAFARSEDRTRALRAGYHAHLAKPTEPAELLATISSLTKLSQSRRTSPAT